MAVSDDLAQMLRLNDEEVDRLDTAFIGTRSVLQELETENISVDEARRKPGGAEHPALRGGGPAGSRENSMAS